MTEDLFKIAAQFAITDVKSLSPLGNGRMHATYLVDASEGRFVLQKMGDAIPSGVVEDIRKVSEHLNARGISTQHPIGTHAGPYVLETEGSRWRLMTYIAGTVLERDPNPTQAASAAAFLGRFHTALLDYAEPFSTEHPQILNPSRAISELERVLTEHAGTAKDHQCRDFAQSILSSFPDLPEEKKLRVLHSDPKLANFIFDDSAVSAIALIDLDTMGRYPLALEVGDMLRSFCTRKNGDSITFDAETWHAALHGYRKTAEFVDDQEWLNISRGFETVTLALAARYLADAYEEKYFALDPAYPTLFEQNLARAHMYVKLVEDFRAKLENGLLSGN